MELTTTTLAIFAIVAAMGLVGLVAVEIISISQDSEARGCNRSVPYNASKGRCFGH
jgi:hypothetical protein